MTYAVSEITLAPVKNVHGGTGKHHATNWVVAPSSVPGAAAMTFSGLDEQVTTKLFAISAAVVPNWFGVAVPSGLSDFTRPHIFFHPTPGQAGYLDGDYANKTGKWPELFYYMERLGYQFDGARRNQVLIMPFMTEEAKSGGILPVQWRSIVTQILRQVRADLAPYDHSPITVRQLVVSSFSAGIIYSDSFRRTATQLGSALAEVWDFDGRYSSYRSLSQALHSTASVRAIKYDQVPSSDPDAYHVPLARWSKLVNPPTSSNEVHGLIRDFMFLDAATVTGVGSQIGTDTETGADSGTVTQSSGGTDSGTTTDAGPYPAMAPIQVLQPGQSEQLASSVPIYPSSVSYPLYAAVTPTATTPRAAPPAGCCAATTGLVAPAAATAQAAVTALVAIAKL